MSIKYRLIDCGDKQKLEVFGDYTLIRPCPQAIWSKTKPELWDTTVDAEFVRTSEEKGVWNWNLPSEEIPKNWKVESKNGLKWIVEPNEFGNIGVFTEHWEYVESLEKMLPAKARILNLFTYSGSNCVYLVKKGFRVTAVDSSRSAMNTYTSNLELNKLTREGQKLILEDCYKFIQREVRREAIYDAVMIDAPTYGRGVKKGEVFKIEDDLINLLKTAKKLISDEGKIVLTLHSPRFTPAILQILVEQLFPDKKISVREILPVCESSVSLPSGFLVLINI
jgi:23S rRNA (cytosine1962-C5)-methyltransferase